MALTVLHNGDTATLLARFKRAEIRAAEQQDWDTILAARRHEVVDEAALFCVRDLERAKTSDG